MMPNPRALLISGMHTREESSSQRLRLALGVSAIFCVLTVARLLTHELWRDEAWLWLVVTQSESLADLRVPLGRSGQGYLFPLLCYVASQLWTSPRAMQFTHLLLATAGAFSFVRWAPLARLERALFVFGYFLFYEYAVISRHYAAGALLVWLACVAARSRRPVLAGGVALALLCQTTVYGFILAFALLCGWLLDRRLHRSSAQPLRRGETATGVAIAIAGSLAGLMQLIPEPGTSFMPGWRLDWNASVARDVLQIPWRALVPLPRPAIAFWNTNVLDPWPNLEAGAGFLTLIVAVLFLRRHTVALVTFCAGAGGVLAFSYAKYAGVMRHQGHLWLVFIAALWLGSRRADDHPSARGWRRVALTLLLTLHVAAGGYASWVDLAHPFSNGVAAAQLLRRSGLDQYPLLGHREPPAATVSLALGQPLYSPSRRVFTTHPDWGPQQRELTPEELRCAARELSQLQNRDIVLVMNWELPPWEEVTRAGSTRGAIQPTEDYHLYQLHHGRLPSTVSSARCSGAAAAMSSTSSMKTIDR